MKVVFSLWFLCFFSVILAQNEQSVEQDTTFLKIGFIGDVMVHQTQLNAQKKSDGTYDFNDNFQPMSALFKSNDIMIANLETTFAGEKMGYSAYPRFNTPDALAEALKNAGVTTVSTANNHMYDTGEKGLFRTLDILNKYNFDVTGSKYADTLPSHLIYELNNMRIGVVAYTYESGKADGLKTINGIRVPKKNENLINSFDGYDYESAMLTLTSAVNEVQNEDIDFLIFIIHWGIEYQTEPNDFQKQIADSLTNLGVDLILGSHPHVVQPIKVIEGKEKKSLVVYSAGNFISNQRYESMKNYHTEDGLYLSFELQKIKGQKAQLKKFDVQPTWVNRYKKENKYAYEVLPIYLLLQDEEAIGKYSEEQKQRMNMSYQRTADILKEVGFGLNVFLK